MKAVIMAGGEGTRLRPLTCDRPKPMATILGKPLMRCAVELLNKHGIYDIAATVAYKADVIQTYFGESLRFFIEDSPLGTAGSVRQCSGFLNETFIVVSGDALTDIDLKKAADSHKRSGAIATIILKRVSDPLAYGVVVTDGEGRVTGFVEKPDWQRVTSDTVNTGIYIFEPEVFGFIGGEKPDFSKDVFPALLKAGETIHGHIAQGYWCDIGDIEPYIAAHWDMLHGRIAAEYQKAGLGTARISPGSVIEGFTYIGEGCVIEEGARILEGAALGRRVYVGKNAVIDRAVVHDGAYIGEGAELTGCLVMDRAVIGKGAALYSASVAGTGSVVASGAVLEPGVRIWPYINVENHERLSGNKAWGSSGGLKFHEARVSGLITPEIACRLGAAFGSLYSDVYVAKSQGAGADMLFSAFIAGAQSSAKAIMSGGALSLGAFVYATNEIETAGCHVSCESGLAEFRLFDRGEHITPAQMRKLESVYLRMDFPRAIIGEQPEIKADAGAKPRFIAWKEELGGYDAEPFLGEIKGGSVFLYKNTGESVPDDIALDIISKSVSYFAQKTSQPAIGRVAPYDPQIQLMAAGSYLFDHSTTIDALALAAGGVVSLSVPCPDRLKGSVLRGFTQRFGGRGALMPSDRGVSVVTAKGLANLAAGDGRSELDILIHASRQEFADELLGECRDFIDGLLKETRAWKDGSEPE